jgi:hypothetical protein
MKRRRHRRNPHWSTDDKVLAAVGVVAAVGIFAIVKQKRAAASAASAATVAGLRGMGAYFVDPVNTPISGLGQNYVSVR